MKKLYVYPVYPKGGTIELVVTDNENRLKGQKHLPYVLPADKLIVDVTKISVETNLNKEEKNGETNTI
ncbi:hypothetical protein KAR91_48895 [Candidatus Pacearchaeota archaeon]|nr:hypothetical protein [Candidatus Pacearchaeota archaeon]